MTASHELPAISDSDTDAPIRLLFVCMGNICRSPAAECVMRELIENANLESRIHCDSAGTIGYHAGSLPDARMREAARQRNIVIDGAARQITLDDFNHFDLILVMDNDNLRNVNQLRPSSDSPASVMMLCEFATQHDDQEVPDPYYGGESGFHHVLDLVTDACQGLLSRITSKR